jgi:hypothetical protein
MYPYARLLEKRGTGGVDFYNDRNAQQGDGKDHYGHSTKPHID